MICVYIHYRIMNLRSWLQVDYVMRAWRSSMSDQENLRISLINILQREQKEKDSEALMAELKKDLGNMFIDIQGQDST